MSGILSENRRFKNRLSKGYTSAVFLLAVDEERKRKTWLQNICCFLLGCTVALTQESKQTKRNNQLQLLAIINYYRDLTAP